MLPASRFGIAAMALALGLLSIAVHDSIAQTPAPPIANSGGESATIPDDLSLLVGKKVVVGRVPLCTPKTYSAVLTYSGKTASVISYSRNNSLDGIKGVLQRMPPASQSIMRDLMKGGLVLLEFDDGTRLDTCSNIGWNAIKSALDLAPGQVIAIPANSQIDLVDASQRPDRPPSIAPTAPEVCPISITGLSSGISFTHIFVEALTTSEFQRQVDETLHDGQSKHYLDVRVHNDSQKPISAFEFGTTYMNRMGDETASATYISQNTRDIKPGEDSKTSTMDRGLIAQSGTGQVKVYIKRIKFDDGPSWQDDGTHSCSRMTNVE